MSHLNPAKVGVTLGILFGGWHLVWSLLIAFGWAQPLLDFVFWAHMLSQPYVVQPFDFTTAIVLIIITTGIGYAVGYCFATISNRAHRGA
jgi:hypothetical protein